MENTNSILKWKCWINNPNNPYENPTFHIVGEAFNYGTTGYTLTKVKSNSDSISKIVLQLILSIGEVPQKYSIFHHFEKTQSTTVSITVVDFNNNIIFNSIVN